VPSADHGRCVFLTQILENLNVAYEFGMSGILSLSLATLLCVYLIWMFAENEKPRPMVYGFVREPKSKKGKFFEMVLGFRYEIICKVFVYRTLLIFGS
jgi:hypothetical protein